MASDRPEAYFEANPRPSSLDDLSRNASAFVKRQVEAKRKIVLVTSGGTTVPLENQTVRFIDNFSAGTRGATSAEYFLQAGYAVIFLHRQFSLLPYSRHFSHSTNCFLDFMTFDHAGSVIVESEYQQQMASVLREYKKVTQQGTLLLLSFTTVNEYLWDLRELSRLLRPIKFDAVFYLAAAVSDFFVPENKMAEHKIQSSEDFQQDGNLEAAARMEGKMLSVHLDPVPKFLKSLVDAWAPDAMIVSFKLETDPSLLSTKAHHALQKYNHHVVIGNLLNTRKREVLFVSATEDDRWIHLPVDRRSKSITEAREPSSEAPTVEIESLIVPEVEKLHSQHIASHQA